MPTYLTLAVLTIGLFTPNLAEKKPNFITKEEPGTAVLEYVLEAPKTPFLTTEDYARRAAISAGLDPLKFSRLIECESRWKEDAAGDNGTSFGLLQFKRQTFEHFTKKYQIVEAELKDPHHQIDLAARMIVNGHLEHWKNCARKTSWN